MSAFSEPTAVFMRGTPGPEEQRLAEAVLEFRPGVLFIISAD